MTPSTSPERRERWPGMDSEAITHLDAAGYTPTGHWTWIPPRPGHVPTERDEDAIAYLIEEFDWGGIEECARRSSSAGAEDGGGA